MRHLAFVFRCSLFGNPGGAGPVAIGHALGGSTLSQKGIEKELQVEVKGAASSRQTAHNKALSASPRGSGNRRRCSVLALSLRSCGRARFWCFENALAAPHCGHIFELDF